MSYNHGEAFNLMQYVCEKCHKVETLWNSRDGVTPFVIDCLACHSAAQHTNWQNDIREPGFGHLIEKWHPTMRVFVDMTKERATEFATRRLISFEGSDYPPPKRDSQEWRELLERISEDFYHNGEGPDIITATEYAALKAEAAL